MMIPFNKFSSVFSNCYIPAIKLNLRLILVGGGD